MDDWKGGEGRLGISMQMARHDDICTIREVINSSAVAYGNDNLDQKINWSIGFNGMAIIRGYFMPTDKGVVFIVCSYLNLLYSFLRDSFDYDVTVQYVSHYAKATHT